MKFQQNRIRIALFTAILALTNCQVDVPTQVESSPPDVDLSGQSGLEDGTASPDDLFGILRLGPRHRDRDDDIRLVPVREGATLDATDAILHIVPGSILDGIVITIEPEDTGYVSFLFGPSGLKFSIPAILIISLDKADLRGIDPRQVRIAGASDDREDWEVVGGFYEPLTNTVIAPIFHFSRYALCVR